MNQIIKEITEASGFIKAKLTDTPVVGIILGSGLGNLAEEIENPIKIPYGDIPHFPTPKVEGHKGQLVIGRLEGRQVLCMQGRFHFYEGYPMQTVALPVRVMQRLDIPNLLVTNAAGGVNKSFKPGTLMLIDDFINFMGDNPLMGENCEEVGPRFPDMTFALTPRLKEIAINAAKEQRLALQRGVYMAFRGPNYETPAEIRFARTVGADAVGMSTVPEILAACHAGMDCLGISCITNMAAGISGEALSHEEVNVTAQRVNEEFRRLVREIVKSI